MEKTLERKLSTYLEVSWMFESDDVCTSMFTFLEDSCPWTFIKASHILSSTLKYSATQVLAYKAFSLRKWLTQGRTWTMNEIVVTYYKSQMNEIRDILEVLMAVHNYNNDDNRL